MVTHNLIKSCLLLYILYLCDNSGSIHEVSVVEVMVVVHTLHSSHSLLIKYFWWQKKKRLFFEFQTLFSIDLNIVQFVDCSTFCVFTVISIAKNRRRRIKDLQVERRTENCAAAIGIRHPKRLLKIIFVPFFLLVFFFCSRIACLLSPSLSSIT